jgi:hypothetical protein
VIAVLVVSRCSFFLDLRKLKAFGWWAFRGAIVMTNNYFWSIRFREYEQKRGL